MVVAPAFFVPRAKPEDYESDYVQWAKFCGTVVPPSNKRIYSITLNKAGGKTWTATVGKTLHGVKRKFTRSKGERTEKTTYLSDPATVIAIFLSSPYNVVTDHLMPKDVGSAWHNPLMVGEPESITYFSQSE